VVEKQNRPGENFGENFSPVVENKVRFERSWFGFWGIVD